WARRPARSVPWPEKPSENCSRQQRRSCWRTYERSFPRRIGPAHTCSGRVGQWWIGSGLGIGGAVRTGRGMGETQGGAECSGTAIEPAVHDGCRAETISQCGGVDLVNIDEQGVITVENIPGEDDLVRIHQGGRHHERVRQCVREVLPERKNVVMTLCDRLAQLSDGRDGQAAVAAM